MSSRIYLGWLTLTIGLPLLVADEPVFSGPQVGEALVPFQVLSVYGETSGKEVDPIEMAGGKPMMLVFVHRLTRPGMALTRALTAYAKTQPGAVAGIVWLDDDKSKAEAYLTRAKKSLNFVVPVGISVDGGEGPGAYGLNRNVELTILIAKDNEVTANFALVQPSVTEGPVIAAELAKQLSKPGPTAEEFEKLAYPGRMRMGKRPETDNDLRSMMRKVIAASATEDELRAAVKAVDAWVGENKKRQAELGRMSGEVMRRGLGPESARKVIKQWQEKYGKSED